MQWFVVLCYVFLAFVPWHTSYIIQADKSLRDSHHEKADVNAVHGDVINERYRRHYMPYPAYGTPHYGFSGGATSAEYMYIMALVEDTVHTAVDDHVVFDTVQSASGTAISLDTTTAYSTASNVDSIGRISLNAGYTYELYGDITYTYGTSGRVFIIYAWFDSDSGTQITTGGRGVLESSTDSNNDAMNAAAIAFVTPLVQTRIELRILRAGTTLVRVGRTSVSYPRAIIKAISSPPATYRPICSDASEAYGVCNCFVCGQRSPECFTCPIPSNAACSTPPCGPNCLLCLP